MTYKEPQGLPRTVVRMWWNMIAGAVRVSVAHGEVYAVIAVWWWFDLFSEEVISGMFAASAFWAIMVATRQYDMMYPVGLKQRKECASSEEKP